MNIKNEISNSAEQTSNSLLVMNGQYYAGENTAGDMLVFSTRRSEAVAVSEAGLKSILASVVRWVVDGEIELKRLEILRVGGKTDV